MTSHGPSRRRLVRLYGVLLRLLPPAFRDEYGALMTAAFSELSVDTAASGGTRGLVVLWLRALGDLLRTAAREWSSEMSWIANGKRGLRALAGLSAMLGAVAWFVVFIEPQWDLVGAVYHPRGISVGAILLAGGLIPVAVIERRSWSRLRRAGFWSLIAAVVLLGVQTEADLLMNGDPTAGIIDPGLISHDPLFGPGMLLLPFAISLLVLDLGVARLRTHGAGRWGVLGLVTGIASTGAAAALFLDDGLLDLWYVYLGATLCVGLLASYRLFGGPAIEVRVNRVNRVSREARA